MSASVLVLLPYALGTTPSQRFRWEQWAPLLRARGVSVRLSPYLDAEGTAVLQQPGRTLTKARAVLSGLRRRAADLRRVSDHTCVVVHRAAFLAGPSFLDRAFFRAGVPVAFDFDDAIFLRNSSGANRLADWLKFPSKTRFLCKGSSLVLAGSRYLASWAAQHNSRVHVVPTTIDVDRFRRTQQRSAGAPVVVGWSGSATSQQHLEQFAPVLGRLALSRPIELRVVSNRPPCLPGIPVSWRRWTAETEVREIEQFDIGIKPLPDDDWARGKCPMKELQYMALEVPAVCSAVGATTEAVASGTSGYLVATEGEWLECLHRLVDSRELRLQMGRAGRTIVERRYATQVAVDLIRELMLQLDVPEAPTREQ